MTWRPFRVPREEAIGDHGDVRWQGRFFPQSGRKPRGGPGQGLGRRRMKRVNGEAHRAQAQTLWLGVWEHNARAQAFYRKCRFTEVGSHVFMVGTDAQTDHILARPVE